MNDEPWKIQDTVQGIDAIGLTHALNIRGNTPEEFSTLASQLKSYIATWKPLPIKQSGFIGKTQAAPKEIKTWQDVPICQVHKLLARPSEQKNQPGTFWWNCPDRTNGEYCRERLGRATPEQVEAYKHLDQDERPKPGDIQVKPSNMDVLKELRKSLKAKFPNTPNLTSDQVDTEAKVLVCIAQTRKQLAEVKQAA